MLRLMTAPVSGRGTKKKGKSVDNAAKEGRA
jgi:hypothetical protein